MKKAIVTLSRTAYVFFYFHSMLKLFGLFGETFMVGLCAKRSIITFLPHLSKIYEIARRNLVIKQKEFLSLDIFFLNTFLLHITKFQFFCSGNFLKNEKLMLSILLLISEAAATSKMERFVIIVNGFQQSSPSWMLQ